MYLGGNKINLTEIKNVSVEKIMKIFREKPFQCNTRTDSQTSTT